MRGLQVLLLLCFAVICPALGQAQMVGYYPKGGADIDALDASLVQLIANPEKYNNKTVRIVGYLHLEFEGNVIYLHKDDFKYAITKNGIWLNVPNGMTKDQVKAVNDHYVICTARFVSGRQGHMGMNSGELVDVSRIEVWMPEPRSTPN